MESKEQFQVLFTATAINIGLTVILIILLIILMYHVDLYYKKTIHELKQQNRKD